MRGVIDQKCQGLSPRPAQHMQTKLHARDSTNIDHYCAFWKKALILTPHAQL